MSSQLVSHAFHSKPQRRRLVEINRQATSDKTEKRRRGGALRGGGSTSGNRDSNGRFSIRL